jgi:hypothetical protein
VCGHCKASSAYVVCDVHTAPQGKPGCRAGAESSRCCSGCGRCNIVLPCTAAGLKCVSSTGLRLADAINMIRGLVLWLWEAQQCPAACELAQAACGPAGCSVHKRCPIDKLPSAAL